MAQQLNHVLLRQKTWVWFPGTTSGGLQSPAVPVPGDQTPSGSRGDLNTGGIHKLTQAQTQKQKIF